GELVRVRAAVGGGRGGADLVDPGGELHGRGDGLPRRPRAGAGEVDGALVAAVDDELHRPVVGGSVGVAEGQRVRARLRGVHGVFDVAAGDVVEVDEAGAGVAGVVRFDDALGDHGVLGLIVRIRRESAYRGERGEAER